jgi:hypothetical protein
MKVKRNQKTAVYEFLLLPEEFIDAFPKNEYGLSVHVLAWPLRKLPTVLSSLQFQRAILKSQLRHLLIGRQELVPQLEGKYQVNADCYGLVSIDPPRIELQSLHSGSISARFDCLDLESHELVDRADTRDFFNRLWEPITRLLTKERICWADGKIARGVYASLRAIDFHRSGGEWRRGLQPSLKYLPCDILSGRRDG